MANTSVTLRDGESATVGIVTSRTVYSANVGTVGPPGPSGSPAGSNLALNILTANSVITANLKFADNTTQTTAYTGNVSYLQGASLSDIQAYITSNASAAYSNAVANAAALYQTTAGLSVNVATLTSNNSTYFGGYTWSSPAAVGTTTANSANFTTVNAASYTVGSAFVANTTGAYHTGTVNAASYTVGSAFVANTIGITSTGFANIVSDTASIQVGNTTAYFNGNTTGFYPISNTVSSALGNTTARWVFTGVSATVSGVFTGGGILITGANSNIGSTTAASTVQLGYGATISGALKTIYLGTSGAAGSTTNVIIGSTLSNTFVTINANTTTFTGSLSGITTVNSASYTVGSAFVANSTVVTTSGLFTGNTGNNFAIGYRDVPQNFTNTTYTFALGDAGKHILTQNSGSSTQTLTLPNSSSVAFQTGTAIAVVVQSAGTVLLANGVGVTMYLAGNSTAKSSITLNTYSQSTALKIGTDTWFITSTSAA